MIDGKRNTETGNNEHGSKKSKEIWKWKESSTIKSTNSIEKMDIDTHSSTSSTEHKNNYGTVLSGSNITLEKITSPNCINSRKTKIVCTIGPACWEIDQLEALIDAGMSVARLNFSHGDHETHARTLDRLRTAAKKKDKHVGKWQHLRPIN